MRAVLRFTFVLLGVGLPIYGAGCDARDGAEATFVLEDAPLESSRSTLLEVAFEAASAMPLEPHIKNRSRVQESVIAACLELDQPQRALRYIERIENWRRGSGYADLAFYCARKGATQADVEPYLEKALAIAEEAADWRRDRIRGMAAKTRAYLGQADEAAELEQGLEAAESGKAAHAEAMICPAESFDEQMGALAKLAESGQFDAVKNVLGAYAELFNRFYTDPERRASILERIKGSWGSMPAFIRIELLLQLADFALAQSDSAQALELVDEAAAFVDSAPWQPRLEIPLKAALAALRCRAGDEEGGRRQAQEALNTLDTKREMIVNIERADMLRSIAEAYHAMGETTVSLDLYRRAVEAGMENPNSRPRAEDLAATCCSMAVHGVEPDAGLLKRIGEIRDGLGDPW